LASLLSFIWFCLRWVCYLITCICKILCCRNLLTAISFYLRRISADYNLRIYRRVLTGLRWRLCNIRRCVLLFCTNYRSILSQIRLSSAISLVLNPIYTWGWDICHVNNWWLCRLWWVQCWILSTSCVLCHWYLFSCVSLTSRSICAVCCWLTQW
jgi:hypothetical protein